MFALGCICGFVANTKIHKVKAASIHICEISQVKQLHFGVAIDIKERQVLLAKISVKSTFCECFFDVFPNCICCRQVKLVFIRFEIEQEHGIFAIKLAIAVCITFCYWKLRRFETSPLPLTQLCLWRGNATSAPAIANNKFNVSCFEHGTSSANWLWRAWRAIKHLYGYS